MKTVIAIVVGYVAWTVVWLAGNAALSSSGMLPSDPTQAVSAPATLAALLVLSIVASVIAGFLAQRIDRYSMALGILIVLLVATGAAVQWSVRALMPIWYHVTFLALLAPMCGVGGRLAGTSTQPDRSM